MIVCLCHGVSDRRIKKLLESGEADSVSTVQAQTHCGLDCGSCMSQLRDLVEAAEARHWETHSSLPGCLSPA
ncbi:MAG: bacterioferritin [Myxococcales bacterium]|nr:bacterioferritin [Myxococcales bacterium]